MSSEFNRENERWDALKIRVAKEHSSGNTNFDIAGEALKVRIDWVRTIKTVREFRNCDLPTAQEDVLSHKGWQRIIQKKLESDPECRKLAHHHCRSHPYSGLIRKDEDRYTIVIRPTR